MLTVTDNQRRIRKYLVCALKEAIIILKRLQISSIKIKRHFILLIHSNHNRTNEEEEYLIYALNANVNKIK